MNAANQWWKLQVVAAVAALILAGITLNGCKKNVQATDAAGGTGTSLAPVAPPPPIELAAGTTLAIRLNQHISVKGSRAGDQFTGEIAEPVVENNIVVVPQGADVSGVVDVSHRRGHFKGRSELALRLTTMTMNGKTYDLDTRDNVHEKKGKGRRTAALIGGGGGAGMLIGGLATGGTGLIVGGLIGAGAGTGVAGLSGNRDINLPAESVVRFTLAQPLEITQQ